MTRSAIWCLCLMLLVSSPVLATEFRVGKSVSIAVDEVIDGVGRYSAHHRYDRALASGYVAQRALQHIVRTQRATALCSRPCEPFKVCG